MSDDMSEQLDQLAIKYLELVLSNPNGETPLDVLLRTAIALSLKVITNLQKMNVRIKQQLDSATNTGDQMSLSYAALASEMGRLNWVIADQAARIQQLEMGLGDPADQSEAAPESRIMTAAEIDQIEAATLQPGISII